MVPFGIIAIGLAGYFRIRIKRRKMLFLLAVLQKAPTG